MRSNNRKFRHNNCFTHCQMKLPTENASVCSVYTQSAHSFMIFNLCLSHAEFSDQEKPRIAPQMNCVRLKLNPRHENDIETKEKIIIYCFHRCVCDASLHGFYSYIFICRLLIHTWCSAACVFCRSSRRRDTVESEDFCPHTMLLTFHTLVLIKSKKMCTIV